ncbi:DUF2917 domain-containing protein [Undibacterium sp. Jales W-56]|uniref:DUF2917 domain-containing protein n=1 Tax=Undibacterium sp. Jales W-56 TaxID=2897325 RepID=UPI0021D2D1EC|nr:DUF2917 domain-containing protein [Undibacterium sp. Jales W-56]MCU6435672.1 DUF2917 domain-containing protein [Undibacterium sp. Jales W-56]
MINNFANPSYTIPSGETVSGTLAQARRIEIACGRVWLTIAGEEHDFWLSAGDSVNLPANRLIVIESDQQASLIELSDVVELTTGAPANQHASLNVARYLQKLSQKLRDQVFA